MQNFDNNIYIGVGVKANQPCSVHLGNASAANRRRVDVF
jgi:hypothetical protein